MIALRVSLSKLCLWFAAVFMPEAVRADMYKTLRNAANVHMIELNKKLIAKHRLLDNKAKRLAHKKSANHVSPKQLHKHRMP